MVIQLIMLFTNSLSTLYKPSDQIFLDSQYIWRGDKAMLKMLRDKHKATKRYYPSRLLGIGSVIPLATIKTIKISVFENQFNKSSLNNHLQHVCVAEYAQIYQTSTNCPHVSGTVDIEVRLETALNHFEPR